MTAQIHPNSEKPPAGTSESTKKSAASNKKNCKPKRPLSAYNLFYKFDRERILAGVETLPTYEEVLRLSIEDKLKPKRSHRKTHGMIGFKDLARTIGARWKELAQSHKQIFEEQALKEKSEYNQKVAAWKKAQIQNTFELSNKNDSGFEEESSCSSMSHKNSDGIDLFEVKGDIDSAETPFGSFLMGSCPPPANSLCCEVQSRFGSLKGSLFDQEPKQVAGPFLYLGMCPPAKKHSAERGEEKQHAISLIPDLTLSLGQQRVNNAKEEAFQWSASLATINSGATSVTEMPQMCNKMFHLLCEPLHPEEMEDLFV